jgi:hypothetical protein
MVVFRGALSCFGRSIVSVSLGIENLSGPAISTLAVPSLIEKRPESCDETPPAEAGLDISGFGLRI